MGAYDEALAVIDACLEQPNEDGGTNRATPAPQAFSQGSLAMGMVESCRTPRKAAATRRGRLKTPVAPPQRKHKRVVAVEKEGAGEDQRRYKY